MDLCRLFIGENFFHFWRLQEKATKHRRAWLPLGWLRCRLGVRAVQSKGGVRASLMAHQASGLLECSV